MGRDDNIHGVIGLNILIVHSDPAATGKLQAKLENWGHCNVECLEDEDRTIFVMSEHDFDVIFAEYRPGTSFPAVIGALWPWIRPVFITDSDLPIPSDEHNAEYISLDAEDAEFAELEERQIEAKMLRVLQIMSGDHNFQARLAQFRHYCDSAIQADTLGEALKSLASGVAGFLPCASAGILSVDDDGSRLLFNCMKELPAQFVDRAQQDMLDTYNSIAKKELEAKKIRIHCSGYECCSPGVAEPAARFYVPALLGDELVGIFGIFTDSPDACNLSSVHSLYYVEHQLSFVLTSLSHMNRIAARDVLTGLYNRRGLNEEYQRAWQLASENDRALGIVTLDIDHFKSVNDTYGHAVGDQVLREMADLLRWAIRSGDVIGRTGGDEMLLVLPMAEAKHIRAFSDRLMTKLREHVFCKTSHGLRLSVSLGAVSCFPQQDDVAPAEILIQSDYALYHAKRTGRDRLCLWADVPTEVKSQPMQQDDDEITDSEVLNKKIKGRILVVDDDPIINKLLQRILERKDYEVVIADSAEKAMDILSGDTGAVDLILVDLGLPGENGLEFLQRLRRMDETVVGIVITGMTSSENILASLRGGAFDFIGKPFKQEMVLQTIERALKFRYLLIENRNYSLHLEEMMREKSADLTRALTDLQSSYMFTLEAFAALVEAREQDTGQHSFRVQKVATMIAEKLELSKQEVEDISRGALLHDIGKIAIPDSILLKPGPLTDEERKVMQTHAEVGYNILKSSEVLHNVAELVYSHQERFDGTGYPRGLKGEGICIGARIFSVIDSYDAMRADRVYRKSMPQKAAVTELRDCSGTQFDPTVVDAFILLIDDIEGIGDWPK